jgi:hypothetical protein
MSKNLQPSGVKRIVTVTVVRVIPNSDDEPVVWRVSTDAPSADKWKSLALGAMLILTFYKQKGYSLIAMKAGLKEVFGAKWLKR